MHKKDWLPLIGFVALSEGAGIVGSFFTTPSIPTWYATLVRPDFAPPNWIFAPVWTTLFLLMGIAAFMVWKRAHAWNGALGIFALQLVLNVVWSLIFFGLRSPGMALIEIIVFWLAITATIAAFWKYSRTAAYLLAPYIAWVSFAGYLNYAIWTLN